MSVAVVCGYKSGGSSLNCLKLASKFFSMGIPDSAYSKMGRT